MIFVTLANKSTRLSEDDVDALKNAGVLTLYNHHHHHHHHHHHVPEGLVVFSVP